MPPDIYGLSITQLLTYHQVQFLEHWMGPPDRGSDVEKVWKRYNEEKNKK